MAFLRKTKMNQTKGKTIFSLAAISIIAALIVVMAYPAYATSAQSDYKYALNQENWTIPEELTSESDSTVPNGRTITMEAKGYAFLRIDEETLKQYTVTTSLLIQVQPAPETTEKSVDVTGSVKVNDETYTIQSGKAILRAEKRLVFIIGQGVDQTGNSVTLKLGARYFWWGGKAYAFRSAALLQTSAKQMLLLQRGIVRIQ
jgi:hypothetical protein